VQRFRAIRTDLVLKLRDDFRFFNSNEVSELRSENEQLKQLVAELSLKNRVLKKSLSGLE
jgi:cell division protein FtsL